MLKIYRKPVQVECGEGTTLLRAAFQAKVPVPHSCGGKGVCEACIVRILSGDVSPPGPEEAALLGPERLAQGYRLACLARPLGDVEMEV